MLTNKGFETVIASDSDYENLICEIYYDGEYLGLVSQETSHGALNFEPAKSCSIKSVELEGLKEILETASNRLKGKPNKPLINDP